MKRILFALIIVIASVSLKAADRDTVLFTGDTLPGITGDTLVFNQTLYVVGRTSSYYLYLSYERLRDPEDVALKGTPAYDSALTKYKTGVLKVYCPYVKQKDTIRLGATVHNLEATWAGARYVKTYANSIDIRDNERPTARPDLGDASLVVCAANLKHYWPDWEGSLSSAKSDTDFQRQHIKLMKALINIDADIFALTELQPGPRALNSIVDGLNEKTQPGLYAYVDDKDTTMVQNIKVGYIYRTDKVVPVLNLGYPYGTTYQEMTYRHREYVQAFDELATGERFMISMNHFKAGAGDSTLLSSRLANAKHLTAFLDTYRKSNYYRDDDILIVGDLNSFMSESPITHIEDAGYVNLEKLMAPTDYSYAYDNKVEYLDYAFATPALTPQVTGVAAYHLNADESTVFYYSEGEDTSMYRYSDHDPILVGLKLHTETEVVVKDTICHDTTWTVPFAEDFGEFYPESVSGAALWLWNSNSGCATVNGFSSGENEEDWLISPYIDLSGSDSAWFSFSHSINYGDTSLWKDRCQLFVSDDFTGNPSEATWKQLSFVFPTSFNQWVADSLTLPTSYLGADSVTIAFRYNDTVGGDIPAWSVRDFVFSSRCAEIVPPVDTTSSDTTSIASLSSDEAWIYAVEGRVVVKSASPVNVEVYDLLGREMARREYVTECTIPLHRGIYIVRSEATVKKVFVR
ncbi:MAG: choice-of-anchor J domain-containing protein [Bacteroidales bacterium]|nr:choice-of-anchor J domain-containing protein [Bacteroidales bacterium]